jgi:hypothetical protein
MKSNAGLSKRDPGQAKVLYYKTVEINGRTLVFASPVVVDGNANLRKALEESRTWGEFRRAIPASEFKEIKTGMRERNEYTAAEVRAIVADDQPFDAGTVPGVEDGEYPRLIASDQNSILPPTIFEKYAKHWGSFNCTDIWRIEVESREAIVADLTALGYEVIERDDLDFG